MASINYAAREINVKIVYYGPGLSGKTTNLQVIHRKVPPEFKSDMVSLATETDRTLFFDFLPLDLGKIKGFSTKFQLYTVPGQVYYNATRKLVLRGVDGIVFVADSGPDKIEENLESFQNLEENLAEYGYKRENIPTIIQYNKRDLPNALSIEEMHQHVNKYSLPWSEAVANKGVGVFDSLKLIGKIVIDYLNKKYSKGGTAQRPVSQPMAPRPAQPTPPVRPPMPPQQSFGQTSGQQQYSQPPRMQPPQQPSMFNQLGGQPGGMRPSQPYQQPPQQQMRPSYPPQQPNRPPIVPPAQLPPNRGTGIRPQPPQQPIRPPQQSGYQPSGYQQPAAPYPVDNNPMQQNTIDFQEDHSFEPIAQQPQNQQQPDPQSQQDFYNYGSINLEPMSQQQPVQQQNYNPYQQPQASASDSVDFNVTGKTDLDLEIERYQREIEEKQRRSRSAGGQPQQPYQESASFEPQQPQQSQNADYDVYNMETPSYGSPMQQQQSAPIIGGADDEEMFFTSVDKDRQKKAIKRPVNPRSIAPQEPQQDKGFLSKFFKKENP